MVTLAINIMQPEVPDYLTGCSPVTHGLSGLVKEMCP